MRRRLDRQERVREALLLDLGAIIFELHRQERREPELLQAKAAQLVEIDDEVRGLTEALGEGYGLPPLTARGLVAGCTACGSIMGVRDRHCPSCGAAAGSELEGDGAWRPAALEEPSYDDEEFEIHEALDPDEDAEEVGHAGEERRVAVGGSNGASPPPWAGWSPDATPESEGREALVPRAQRTLRAGRRLARHWLEARRTGGR